LLVDFKWAFVLPEVVMVEATEVPDLAMHLVNQGCCVKNKGQFHECGLLILFNLLVVEFG